MSTVVTTMPGQETLIACWAALAQTSAGAEVIRATATTAAVFPSWAPLNNAILIGEDVGPAAAVVEELGSLYAEADVDVWALWVPSRATDLDAPDEVRDMAGLTRDTTTLIIRAHLTPGLCRHHGVVRASLTSIVRITEDEPVPVTDLGEPDTAPDLTAWALVHDGVAVSCAWSYLHGHELWDLCGRDPIALAAPGLCAIALGAHPCGTRVPRRSNRFTAIDTYGSAPL